MPTRNNRGKKKLPANLDPSGELCVPVYVPNDPEWIGLFTGALFRLGQQIWYDRDEAHGAKIVADRWKLVYDRVIGSLVSQEGCGGTPLPQTLVRQNAANRCTLEYSLDDGLSWVPFANLKLCMPNIRRTTGGDLVWYDDEGFGFYRFPDGGYTPPSKYPEFGAPAVPEGPTDDAKRCNASYAAALVLQAFYQQTVQVFIDGAARGAFWIVQEMIDMVSEMLIGNWIWDLAYDAYTDLFTQVDEFVPDGFPDAEIENVQNILYCRSAIDAEGIVTFDYAGVIADFGAEVPSPYPGLNFLLQLVLGEDGLNKAGGVHAGDGDCSGADCPPDCAPTDITYSFTGAGHPHHEVINSVYYTLQNGFWVQVWDGTGDKVRIHVDQSVANGVCQRFGFWVRYADVPNQAFRLTWPDTGQTMDISYPSGTGWKYFYPGGYPEFRGDIIVEKLGSGVITWQHVNVYGTCP